MKALLLALLTAAPAGAAMTAIRPPPSGAAPFGAMAPLPALPPSALLLQPAFAAAAFSAPASAPLPSANAPVPAAAVPAAKPAFSPGVIALVQYDGDAHFGDYDHNLRELTRLAEEAVARGAKIIVTPEGSLYGYADKDELWCKPGMTERSKSTRLNSSHIQKSRMPSSA